MNEEVKIPDNIEINQALKEFEHEASLEQIKKVPEDKKTDIPKMVQFMMKLSGLPQKQAEYVLLGLVVLMFVVSFYLFFSGSSRNSASDSPGLEMFQNINPRI
jgi:hypothetical protein